MNKMQDEYGVTNVRWTDEELAPFEKAWHEVLEEQSATDPLFKKVADSYLAFREVYKTWGDAQALKPTYASQCRRPAPSGGVVPVGPGGRTGERCMLARRSPGPGRIAPSTP